VGPGCQSRKERRKDKIKDEENVRLAWVLLAAVHVADAEVGRIGLVRLLLFPFFLFSLLIHNLCILNPN
jgi:hypothetical protein